MLLIKKSFTRLFFLLLTFIGSINLLPLTAAWSPGVQISAGPASTNPNGTPLVIDSKSVALVGWLDGQIGIAQTLSSANLFPNSDVWTSPELIFSNTTAGLFPSFPTMSQDIFGNKQVAAFGLIDPMSGMIVFEGSKRSTRAQPWRTPVSQNTEGIPAAASLANDDLGNVAVLLALTPTGGPPYNITLLQLPVKGTTWLPMITFAQDNSPQPAVAAKWSRGIGSLAWKVNTPTLQLQTIRFNVATQQASPVINVPLPPGTTDIIIVDIAVDSFGDAVIIYVAQIGAGNALYSSTRLAGANTVWSNPLLISDPTHTVTAASIASDAVGNMTILWGEQITPTQQFVRAATLPLSGTPTFVTDLTNRNSLNTLVDASSRVVMDQFGNAAAVWGITTAGLQQIQVSSKPFGQNWTAAETLSNTGVTPLITLSNQGTAVVTWIDTVTSILMGSRNLFLFPLNQPFNFVGKMGKNEFLTQTAYVLKMRWNASRSPNIIRYEIFKDGVLIATIPGNGPLKYVAPLQGKNIQGTYTLVAVASNGNKSIPIPIEIQKK